MVKRTSCSCNIADALFLVLLAGVSSDAQWLKLPATGPRTPDGKLNLTGPVPMTLDQRPDLSGIWLMPGARHLRSLAADLKPGELPILPWAEELTKRREDGSQSAEESDANCLPSGLPKINSTPNPMKIIQQPNLVVILYEALSQHRQIFLDGRELAPDVNPTWLGYSVGHWERDTLVVETRGLNGKTWLDEMGHPTSDALHVVERFRRFDYGHLAIQMTVDDPKVFSKPWSVTENYDLMPSTEIIEFVCNENEKDIKHIGK